MRPSSAHLATAAVAGLLYVWWRRRRRPACVVDGCAVYVVDAKDADDVIDHLTGDVLGVDVEWPPSARPRCAVLQIASKHACVVIRVGSATCLPPRTTLLLTRAICVGVGIREDCQLVLRDLGCACGRQVDLRTLSSKRDAGLASLAAEFAPSCTLPHKNEIGVRRSDWSADPLTPSQIEYAAGDAIASYRVAAALAGAAPLGEWLRAAPAAPPQAKARPKPPSTTTQNDARARHKQERRKRYEAWHAEHAKSHHYDNIPLVSKSGRLLGLVAKGKADWYCDRGLGERDSEGRVVLDYDPDIVDDDRCLTAPRKNECVGCGNTQHLTRFYVVPYRFRRCFPEAFKQHASHDVVALCLRCRDIVEPFYHRRTRSLEAALGPASPPRVDEEAALRLKAMGAAKTLVRDRGRIPAERREFLREIVSKAYPGRAIEAVAAMKPPPKVRSKVSVDDDSLEARCLRHITREGDVAAKILAFEVAWRRCFVDSLRPSHLPEGWTVEHTIVPRARPPPSTLVCRAHLKGRCTWGRACKYRHE